MERRETTREYIQRIIDEGKQRHETSPLALFLGGTRDYDLLIERNSKPLEFLRYKQLVE